MGHTEPIAGPKMSLVNYEPPSVASLVQPRIAELGKLKLGGKSPEVRKSAGGAEWRAPVKFDHFVITGLQRDERGDLVRDEALMKELSSLHGDKDGKLRRIPVMLLSNDIDDIVQASYVWYGGKKVAARSDGRTVTFYVNPNTKQAIDPPIEKEWTTQWSEWKDAKGNRIFKLHTVFNCVIMSREARWGGVYKFRTTSRISASQLVGSLIQIQQLTGGVLRGLPLQIVVRPVQVAPEGRATNVYVVHVELLGSDIAAIQDKALALAKHDADNRRQMLAIESDYRKMLRAPGELETSVEAADIAEEFHPEENGGTSESGKVVSVEELTQDTDTAPEVEQPGIPDAEYQDIEQDDGQSLSDDVSFDSAPGPSVASFDVDSACKQYDAMDSAISVMELDDQVDKARHASPGAFSQDAVARLTEASANARSRLAAQSSKQAASKPAASKQGTLAPAGPTKPCLGAGCPEWKSEGIGRFYLKCGGKELATVAESMKLPHPDKMTGGDLKAFATKLREMETAGTLAAKEPKSGS